MAREVVVAFAGAAAAKRDQGGEIAVAVAVLRKHDELRAIGEPEFAADQQLEADLLGCDVGTHDAGERALIGDRQRGVAEFGGAHDQFLRVRGAAQEAEVGNAMQFGVAGQFGGHEKCPCRNQPPGARTSRKIHSQLLSGARAMK